MYQIKFRKLSKIGKALDLSKLRLKSLSTIQGHPKNAWTSLRSLKHSYLIFFFQLNFIPKFLISSLYMSILYHYTLIDSIILGLHWDVFSSELKSSRAA